MFKQMKQDYLFILLSMMSLFLLTFILQSFSAFESLELRSFDHRSEVFRIDKKVHDDVVVVLLDENSLQKMQQRFGRWPWPRSAYEDVLTFFGLAKAQSVAFDILFSEQQRSLSESQYAPDDQNLIAASKKAGNVVHAMQLTDIVDRGDSDKSLPIDFVRQHQVNNIRYQGKKYTNFLIPIDGLYQAAQAVGNIEMVPDSDGVYRRVRLFNEYQGAIFPSMAAAITQPLMVGDNEISYNLKKADFGGVYIPLDGNGKYLINPVGDINTVSIATVFKALDQIEQGKTENLVLDPRDFEDKIILIGASAIGLLDVKATALSSAEPGVFLHASAISNILEMDFLEQPSKLFEAFIYVLAILLTLIPITLLSRLSLALVIPLISVLSYVVASYLLFANNVLMPITPVVFTFIVTIFVSTYFRLSKEKLHKQKIRNMFSQYVSPSVLNSVINNEDELSTANGTSENLTILFSDIRGFTNMSEQFDAAQVVDILNIYFSEMTTIIFEHQGTLNKFIGDAIMAFWGAPIKTDHHADEALATAILMREKMPEVNQKLMDKGYHSIDIGVGIHTGEVVLGNIGSHKKLEYTIIGDAVNLASRVEGLTKQYGISILVTEDTLNSTTANVACLKVDKVRVKGKKMPVMLLAPAKTFIVENNLSMSVDSLLNLTDSIFESFQHKEWQKAKELMAPYNEILFFKVISQRCDFYLENPPTIEWDGVYEFVQK